jgi:Na+/melibiose symporter-like transporter
VYAFDSMQTDVLRALAGGCIGAAFSLLSLLDRRSGNRIAIALGCGALVFSALGLLWLNTPTSSVTLLLVALAVAAVIAWGVWKIE